MDGTVSQKEIKQDFDYTKLTEEAQAMKEWCEQMSSEIQKMKVECAIANIDLASTVEAINFESKIKAVEKMIEVFGDNMDKEMKELVDENHAKDS